MYRKGIQVRRISWIGVCVLVAAPAVWAQGPRQRLSLDLHWRFQRGQAQGADQPGYDDRAWRTLDLPHDWGIEGPYAQDEPTSGQGGYLPTGVGWYRRHLRIPDAYRDKKVSVEFDGMYENSQVWVNGHPLGHRPFGYIGFRYDLTGHLVFGGQDNVIAVRVDNSRQPNSRWYSGSGIYRHVWLTVTHPVHVAPWGTFVTTPKVSQDTAIVRVQTRLQNEQTQAVRCTLTTSILDAEAKVVGSVESGQDVSAQGDQESVHEVAVRQPSLWSVEAPYLYTLRTRVRVGDQVVDECDTPFGIREAVFDADRGFLLNGRAVKLNGVCLHHDAGCMGAAVPERVWQRRLEILRDMGCNAIRTAHNPPAPEFLDLCDRMGFLVMDEAFDEWKVPKGQIGPHGYHLYFDAWSERDVTDLVRRDRNHCSVVLWSAGNEVGDQTAQDGVQTLRRLLEIFHREDPTRPVTVGCDQIAAEPRSAPQAFLDLLDVVGYNYADRWRDRAEKVYSIDRHAYPNRKVIGTESGSMGGVRGDYRALVPDQTQGPFGLFRGMGRGRMIDVEQLWRFVRTYDYVAGDFMWTGIDYLGESRWPSKAASSGVLDTCGFRKDGYYFYQSQWTDRPMVHLFPHWNWQGRQGRIIPVTCYTNCDTVELFVNGKSYGVKGYAFPRPGMELRYGNYPARARALRTTADLHLTWDVPYEPGTIKAVGTKDGREACVQEISTTGPAAAIGLAVDRDRIAASRQDVAHVTVAIVDAQGRTVPTADNEVRFEIQGPGKILGVDNGDPASHEDYKADHRKAFNSLCLAIVQASQAPARV
ncbi:MAG: DUF4982 domain-containing protein, partial [Phycisphaerae bacterium]|nr:DUF4982 domain-containing protein [Phycisphaerae bacterium]